MKVLFVSSGNSNYGISPIIKSQGESLRKEGIELDYYPIYGRGFVGYLKSTIKLRKYIRNRRYNIIHAHYGLSAMVALLAKKRERIVVSFMGDDLVGSNNLNGSITISSKCLVYINKFLAKHYFDLNIVKSKEMFNILNLSNCQVIPNGVDFERFYEIEKTKARINLGDNLSIKQVLFCSNPDRPEKNFKLAEKAINFLVQDKIQLRFINGIDQTKLAIYYNSADCLLLTSFHEGSPNVIKEAMACGTPIVSTNVGDVKDIIGSTEGCFITTFKPEDVAEKIKMALVFKGRTNGRENIKHLESSLVAKNIIDLYNRIIE